MITDICSLNLQYYLLNLGISDYESIINSIIKHLLNNLRYSTSRSKSNYSKEISGKQACKVCVWGIHVGVYEYMHVQKKNSNPNMISLCNIWPKLLNMLGGFS